MPVTGPACCVVRLMPPADEAQCFLDPSPLRLQVRRAAYLYRQPTLEQQLRVAGGWAQVSSRQEGRLQSSTACCRQGAPCAGALLQPDAQSSNACTLLLAPLLQAASKQLRAVLAEAAGRGASQR